MCAKGMAGMATEVRHRLVLQLPEWAAAVGTAERDLLANRFNLFNRAALIRIHGRFDRILVVNSSGSSDLMIDQLCQETTDLMKGSNLVNLDMINGILRHLRVDCIDRVLRHCQAPATFDIVKSRGSIIQRPC